MSFTLRFDMRTPDFGAPAPDLYSAAIDMCAWAEHHGGTAAVLSEHHATADNHLPSPLLLAAAIAARTERLGIVLAAVVLPFHDPVRLAEDMSVLDIISRGRVSHVLGVGHRPEEYEHLGIDRRRRGALADEHLALLLELLKGAPVNYQGRRIHITPPPLTPGGPRIMIAGGSVAAARRAGRHGLGLLAQANPPGLKEAYEAECLAHGHLPGPAQFPDPRNPTAVFVADDVDAAWDELGPYLLHDARMAASYRRDDPTVASISRATTAGELRAERGAYRILTTDEAASCFGRGERLGLLPLCGGLPPALAWPYLERAADAVTRAGNG